MLARTRDIKTLAVVCEQAAAHYAAEAESAQVNTFYVGLWRELEHHRTNSTAMVLSRLESCMARTKSYGPDQTSSGVDQ